MRLQASKYIFFKLMMCPRFYYCHSEVLSTTLRDWAYTHIDNMRNYEFA
jgi:hypothetical protein